MDLRDTGRRGDPGRGERVRRRGSSECTGDRTSGCHGDLQRAGSPFLE